MTIYSVWPTFACLVVIVLLTRLPVFDRVGFKSNAPRVNVIDGARGFLALSVALHHSVIYYHFIRTGEWVAPPSRFYTLAGQLSVACFFTITGYLFWRKIVQAKGCLDFADLMRGRFFRLAPVYLVTAFIAIVIIFIRSGGVLNIPLPQYLLQIAQNLAVGIFPFVNMNGESASFTATAGVTWTLQYEWQFYFALPLLAIFARNDRLHLPFAVSGLFVALALFLWAGVFSSHFMRFFACGMVTASLEAKGYKLKLPAPVLSALCAGNLILIPLFYGTANQPEVALLLGLSFYFLVSGASLFGLLVARPSVLLGELSYSIYLMQGIVLYFVFAIDPLREFALASDASFWIVIFITLVTLVFVALAIHILVERPGVELGQKLREERLDLMAPVPTHSMHLTPPLVTESASGP